MHTIRAVHTCKCIQVRLHHGIKPDFEFAGACPNRATDVDILPDQNNIATSRQGCTWVHNCGHDPAAGVNISIVVNIPALLRVHFALIAFERVLLHLLDQADVHIWRRAVGAGHKGRRTCRDDAGIG